jgi:ATP-dependent DNA helicase DinG
LDTRLLHWFQSLRLACSAVERLFISFASLVEDFNQQSGRDKGRGETSNRAHVRERTDQPLRLNGNMRHLSAWNETEDAWKQATQRLRAVVDLANAAEKIILSTQSGRRRGTQTSGEDSSVAAELVDAAYQLTEMLSIVEQALSNSENDAVYWLRMPPPALSSAQYNSRPSEPHLPSEPVPTVYSQIVQPATSLRRFLLKDGVSNIFAGTALSVDGSFAFARQRLGFEHDDVPVCSVIAEHHEQTLIYLPNDVPEPNAPQYQRHLDEALINLATAMEGQVVALFTSHAALRSTYTSIKPILEARNILVLGQGADGSPRQLWQVFQSQERVVLLGTGSFWDTMDDINKQPTCLFIARLPMPVLNDPPIAARAEQYSDQLHQLTIPIATLRTRRVLDHLMWGEKTRNAVVLFDRRVTSKEYGSTILHSLPRCSQRQDAVSQMPDTILDWLTAEGAWQTDD